MERVTLLLSGVPRYVSIPDLSYHLDLLFNTDEIGTFKARDLPNHPQTNKRQVALDFMSSYDAMIAQEKLEGYQYEMRDGRQYTLRAKINKDEQYMQSELRSAEWPGNPSWYGPDWQALALMPNLDGEMYHRVNARLDAQLDLLKKQCRVIEKEKEILREKRRLRREYGNMVSSFCQYEVPSRPWMEQTYLEYIEHGYDESEASSSKRSRSRSRDHRSGSWHRRSRSRERHMDRHSRYRSRSKDRGYKVSQIEWHDVERSESYGKRSRHAREPRDRSSSRESSHRAVRYSPEKRRLRELRSGSKEPTVRSKNRRSRSNEPRSTSKDRISRSKELGGNSRERSHRDKSVSRERSRIRQSSRDEKSKERRSPSHDDADRIRRSSSRGSVSKAQRSSRERRNERSARSRERSRSKDRSISRERIVSSIERWSRFRRSRSRDRPTNFNDRTMSGSDLYCRRAGSTERRAKPLAIMPRVSKRSNSTTGRIILSYEDIKPEADIQNKAGLINEENDDDNNIANENKAYNITEDESKKPKSKEEKKIAKFNSKMKKGEILEARVKEFTKDVMIPIRILLEDIMNKDKIKISASSKLLLVKELEELVEERVEPLARKRKNTDIEVLMKYKELYPKEEDSVMIKQMLAKIPKIQMLESQSTATVSSEKIMHGETDPVIINVENTERQQDQTINLTQSENVIPNEILPQIKLDTVTIDSDSEKPSPPIKEEKIEVNEKPVIIDVDSANKPVPRNPQFVVVIKTLVKKMNKSGGLNKLLGKESVKIKQFNYVLRHILRNLLKGQGHLPRSQIISKFREIYPVCKDEEFVKNIIKDIKDGKYPGCMDYIDITTGNDQPDDVVVIEKQYDIVTVADSDDEDNKSLEVVEQLSEQDQPKAANTVFIDTQKLESLIDEHVISLTADRSSHIVKIRGIRRNRRMRKRLRKRKRAGKETRNTPEPGNKTIEYDKDAKNDHVEDKIQDGEMVQDRTSQITNDDIKDNQADKNDNTEKIQGHESSKVIDDPVQDKLNTKENKKENDSNDLRVTAITIMTSLSDLLAKSTNEPKEPSNDIKEELEYEEDRPDDSSLQLVPDNDPKVTSITIMTSDAELFSIGQDGGQKKVDEIKREEETYYDTEESLLNEIERDINNDKFTLQMNNDYHNVN